MNMKNSCKKFKENASQFIVAYWWKTCTDEKHVLKDAMWSWATF